MKNIFYILLLLPTIIFAQYPSNGNQKITLGEQTTADGLIYRGVAATDTVRKPSVDTMAYMVLDTTTNIIWHYKKATSNAWLRLNLLPSDTASMLTNYWRAGRFSGVLPVANGGTNRTTMPDGYILHGDGTSVDTSLGLFWDRTNNRLGINNNLPSTLLYIIGGNGDQLTLDNKGERYTQLSFKNNASVNKAYVYYDNNTSRLEFGGTDNTAIALITDNSEKMRVNTNGEVWIGYTTDQGAYTLQVNGQIFATNATIATSDIRFKENIKPLDKGLEIINKLKPVKFNFITTTENNFSEFDEIGFIAQDVDRALSTETFAKSIVKAADDSDPNSTMGLASQNLIPLLVKAIQEQQAQIEQLKQRIINLENK
jgi:hypothetical protein